MFRSSLDFEMFQALLLAQKKRFDFCIHHYCLMNTHFHLAVSIPSLKGFSLGMKRYQLPIGGTGSMIHF